MCETVTATCLYSAILFILLAFALSAAFFCDVFFVSNYSSVVIMLSFLK